MSDDNIKKEFPGSRVNPVGVFGNLPKNEEKLDWGNLHKEDKNSRFAKKRGSKDGGTWVEKCSIIPSFLLRSGAVQLLNDNGEEFTVKLSRNVRSCFEDGDLFFAVAKDNPSLVASRVDISVQYLLGWRDHFKDSDLSLSQLCKVSECPQALFER